MTTTQKTQFCLTPLNLGFSASNQRGGNCSLTFFSSLALLFYDVIMDLVIVGNFLLFSCFEVIFADLQSKRMGMCNRREKADLSLSLSLSLFLSLSACVC